MCVRDRFRFKTKRDEEKIILKRNTNNTVSFHKFLRAFSIVNVQVVN